jgi:hypothetical protein
MSRPPLSLLRRLHRSLAYSTVGALIGTPVEVHSAETALDDVLRAARLAVPLTVTTMAPDLHYRAGAIAKYGILDVSFGIGSTPVDVPRPGLGALRSVGLVDGGESTDATEIVGDFLRDLTLECEAGKLYLKVFLRTEDSPSAVESMRRLRDDMPPGFWPHLFFVWDACLTSAPSIWLDKHFYL